MIKDAQVAQIISDLMVEYLGKLDRSIALVKEKCTEKEFKEYRSAAAKVMGYMIYEVMNPLYKEHPEIKPKEAA